MAQQANFADFFFILGLQNDSSVKNEGTFLKNCFRIHKFNDANAHCNALRELIKGLSFWNLKFYNIQRNFEM